MTIVDLAHGFEVVTYQEIIVTASKQSHTDNKVTYKENGNIKEEYMRLKYS